MIFFSVITPTYNRADILGSTIDSVLSQEFEDFELLIIDDGSNDHTKTLVSTYSDKRIRYIYQDNGERGKARNTGVKNAIGKYVFFLDSDDLIYPNHLKHAFQYLKLKNFPEFFRSRYEEIDLNGNTTESASIKSTTIKDKIKRRNLFACQFFLRSDIALKHPFTENMQLKIGEDWELILKIAARYDLNCSNEITSAIIHHNQRSMILASAETILVSKNIIIENLQNDVAIEHDVLQSVNAELTSLAALSAVLTKNKKLAWQMLKKAISFNLNQLFTKRTFAIVKHILLPS